MFWQLLFVWVQWKTGCVHTNKVPSSLPPSSLPPFLPSSLPPFLPSSLPPFLPSFHFCDAPFWFECPTTSSSLVGNISLHQHQPWGRRQERKVNLSGGLSLCWECLAGRTGSRRVGEGTEAPTNEVALVTHSAYANLQPCQDSPIWSKQVSKQIPMSFSLSLEERFCSAENLAVFIAVTAWNPPFAYANHTHLCKFLGE